MANAPVKTFYYTDPLNDDFAGTNIKQKPIDESYNFVRKGPLFRFFSFLVTFVIAIPILRLYLMFKHGFRVKNRKVLRKVRGQTFFLYGNHTHVADSFIPQAGVLLSRKVLIIANPDVTSIKGIKTLVEMLGAIPLPDPSLNYEASKNFVNGLKYHVSKKRAIAIYPEAHIWPYYTGIRPFLSNSFIYPVNFNAPVIAMTTTYRARKRHKPAITVTLSDVFYPNTNVSKKDARELLRNEVYDFMIKTANDPLNYKYYEYLPKS